jgi:hypothetical protein
VQLEWETIDDLLYQGRQLSENKYANCRSGNHPWSPELDRAGCLLSYWLLRIREFTSKTTNLAALDDLANRANTSEELRDFLLGIRSTEGSPRQGLKRVQLDADVLHEQYLAESAKFYAVSLNTTIPNAAASIAARERVSKQYRQLREVLKNLPGRRVSIESTSLSFPIVPNDYAVLLEGEAVPRIPLVTKE